MRDFDPVPPVDLPERYSQTLLKQFDRCPRSAYLYLKHEGGPRSHAMDRGSAYHRFAERAVRLLVDEGEATLPPEIAKDLMAEVLQSPDLVVPAAEHDRLRQMAYHFATGVVIDPSSIIAIEKPFYLQIEEFTVSCRIDLAFRNGDTIDIWDWKTSFAMAGYDELATHMDGRYMAKGLQLLIYALVLAYGYPVGEDTYSDGVNLWRGFEVYPQYLFDDGMAMRGPLEVARPELIDHRMMLEGLVLRLARGLQTWDFPAVPGSHCSECSAPAECPIPPHLRDHAGSINSMEQAAETAEALHVGDMERRALQKELKNFAALHGPVRYGKDRVRDFADQESRKIEVDELLAAAEHAANYGEILEVERYVRTSRSTRFRDRKLTAEELAEDA